MARKTSSLRGWRAIALALLSTCALSAVALTPGEAQAFCGFYVSGADQEMFNNATMVVMMREGTKTVLSMRNNYEGPPEGFAMVIPVPQVLEEENVKVLKDELFTRVDQLAAPRLVEYWEQDPCYQPVYDDEVMSMPTAVEDSAGMRPRFKRDRDTGVKIEAQFDVGEYNVVILSAKESNGLEKWLEQEKYNIPKGAAPVLKPYIEGGQYFFVAKVDPKKVTFKDGQARLSPLRFHYDSKEFSLPVRLGLLNAKGHQDLIVHILARETRYEVANFKNVAIPTNLFVDTTVRDDFAAFYVSLFDWVLQNNPGAVITEYAWASNSCDPCPTPPLQDPDLMTLGGDVVVGKPGATNVELEQSLGSYNWVLTRLHARYTIDDLKDDLVFRAAPPIIGGRGTPYGPEAKLNEEGAQLSSYNNFQGRYIMLNRWEGKVECENPQYGIWGGPPNGGARNEVTAAQDTAFAKRGAVDLEKALAQESIPTVNLLPEGPYKVNLPKPPRAKMCACRSVHTPSVPTDALGWLALGALAIGVRRRKTSVN
jgi:hypothetical protein